MTPERAEFDLGNGYHWVGSRTLGDNLQCNPYLLVDGDDAVLFDPGSVLDIETVMRNVAAIVPLEKVRHVVLHHQDPDFVSGVPAMEAAGMKFTVVTHWRTWTLVRYYGISSGSYLVDEHGWALHLPGGRTLQFIPTPYLHFPGAIVTYDKGARLILSSDLFGAFSSKWSLFADEYYEEGMKAFHEHYMPGNEILRPVMELFLELDLGKILPQHGSIIREDLRRYILALRDLECGSLMRPLKKNLMLSGGYRIPVEEILTRVAALFGTVLRDSVIARMGITYDPDTRKISDYSMSGEALWNGVVESVYLEQGIGALNVLEPLVNRLSIEYDIPVPIVYGSALSKIEKSESNLVGEVQRLARMTDDLNQTVSQTQDSMLRDPVTGMYNEQFYRNFMDERIPQCLQVDGGIDNGLAVFGIDEGMAMIELHHGPKEVETVLKSLTRLFNESKPATHPVFRLYGATFALWIPSMTFEAALEECETIRKKVQASKAFIEPLTVSAGLVMLSELRVGNTDVEASGGLLTEIGSKRLRIAKRRGGDTICSSSELSAQDISKAKILVADDDAVNTDVLKTFLENANYSVFVAEDGKKALELISKEGFDIVISELMIPKTDAFSVKESMSLRSGTKNIPFILLSHLKDEQTIVRAAGLGIVHYLKKPFMIAELMGIVSNLVGTGERK